MGIDRGRASQPGKGERCVVCVCVCVYVCEFRIWTVNKITKTQNISDNEKYYGVKLNREEVREFRESCLHESCCFRHIQIFVTLQPVAHQALLSTGFSRQEYWSGLQFPSPGGSS